MSLTEAPDRPRRRIEPDAKREAILQAAAALFAAQGYERTSIADVAKAAGVAVGSVYRVVPDKPALLAALHSRIEDGFVGAMQKAWDGEPDYRRKFAALMRATLAEAETNLSIMPVLTMTKEINAEPGTAPGEKIVAAIEAMYADGVSAGAFREADPAIVATIAHGMVDGAMRYWLTDPRPETRHRVEDTLIDLYEAAFLAR